MKIEKRLYISIFWVITGAVLFACGVLEIIDSFWSGMGGGLIGVGMIRIIQYIKYRKNPEYREKVEIESKDERNQFIAIRAWAWSGYAFIMISAVGTIAFYIAGNETLSQFCAYAVCLVLVLYWISYLILRRKY